MKARRKKLGKRPPQRAKPLLSKAGPSVSKRGTPRPEPEGLKRLQVTLRLRPSLKKAMEAEAQAQGLTVQALCLLGLRKLGLPVTSADLADGRKSDARAKQKLNRNSGSGDRHGRQSRSSSSGARQLHDHPVDLHQLIELILGAIGQHNANLTPAPNINIMCSRCDCM